MQKDISHIYIGLPKDYANKCFWVGRDYRKNVLSFVCGGCDVVIEYSNGEVLGYDWIKYPSRYVYKTLVQRALKKYKVTNFDEVYKNRNIVSLISRVFARTYGTEEYQNKEFTEVWNTSLESMPWEKLEEYTYNVNKSYLDYFSSKLELIKTYLSVWYPFDYNYLLKNWEFIEKGNAYYTTYISDTEWIYTPKLGLSFNQNIRWNSKLRSKWDYGFSNPYIGHIEGTGQNPVEYDEHDFLDIMLPLDINKEIECKNTCIINSFQYENDGVFPNFMDSNDINRFPSFLNLSNLDPIISNKQWTFLTNKDIWLNTMSKIIDEDFCDEIFDKLKSTVLKKE